MWKCINYAEAVELDGEWIVLDAEKYLVTKLNEIGGYIYTSLQKGSELQDIVQSISEQYEVPYEEAHRDSLAFIQHLVDCGLVEHVA